MFCVLFVVVLGTARVSFAKLLFGQNYTWLSYSYFDYGDSDKSYLDDGNGGSVLVNLKHDSDEDILLGVDYLYSDGERYLQDVEISALTFRADLVHAFCESEKVSGILDDVSMIDIIAESNLS